jgi:hypothetical protein
MLRRTFLLTLVLACSTAATFAAQSPVPLTDKLTNLEGTWIRDRARGTGGICGVNPADRITIKVSATEVMLGASPTAGATATVGIVRLDGAETFLADGRTAKAALDAGWLAVTNRRPRNGGFTNVMREVYIPLRGELTVWRTLNVERPDGGPDKIDCGNHHAIVYTRESGSTPD